MEILVRKHYPIVPGKPTFLAEHAAQAALREALPRSREEFAAPILTGSIVASPAFGLVDRSVINMIAGIDKSGSQSWIELTRVN